MAAPILNLDTLADRPTVVVRGTECWLLTLDILPPLDSHRLEMMSNQLRAVMGKSDRSESELADLDTLPDKMCRIVLVAPDDVHQQLTNPERMLIVETAVTTFRSGLRMMPPIAAPESPGAPSIGESGSPA